MVTDPLRSSLSGQPVSLWSAYLKRDYGLANAVGAGWERGGGGGGRVGLTQLMGSEVKLA